MSNPSDPNSAREFQARFGVPPGSQDPAVECAQWQRLCAELLSERTLLQAQLDRARLAALCKDFRLDLTMEEVYAQVDKETSLEQLIVELENQL
jgi:hypothetical protein